MIINIIFILSGLVLLQLSEMHRPRLERWRIYKSTPQEIYRGYRSGQLRRPPAWSFALQVLGLGLSVLGFWRLWSGA
jgi:hypothetical protein